MSELEQQAKALAARKYIVITWYDDPDYIAGSPEMPGCLGCGATPQAARDDLKAARYDYILSLLEDGLAVPEPGIVPALTWTSGATHSETRLIDLGHGDDTRY